jgi:hypothetical protein
MFVDDGTGVVTQAIRLLDAASVEIGRVSVSQPSLDEVFLKATGSRLEGAAAAQGGREGQDDRNSD